MVAKPRVAIVGTGIAGNVAAYKLNQQADITVFEANNYIGGHSNTLEVETERGPVPVDTGFIVFNDRTYPNFIALLDELGVASQDSTMSFSVQTAGKAIEYNGAGLNALFAQRRNLLRPSFHRMIRDILRFNEDAKSAVGHTGTETSLAEFLRAGAYSREFIEHYLVPMGAAIWSAEPDMMSSMPADFFLRFFENHGLLDIKNRPQWKTICGGSREYVANLVAGHRDRIRLGCAVQKITRAEDRVLLHLERNTIEEFDYVFLACHSDQALRLLESPSQTEKTVLGAIPYQYNQAILHTDASLMPRRKLAWGAWNYHLPEDGNDSVTLTYHLNTLQRLQTEKDYFVTLNSNKLIRPDSVIAKVDYEHPVFTASSVAAQNRQQEVCGIERTYYCGAYWRYGFHEDGVVSALNALKYFAARHENAQQHFQRAS